MKTRLLIQQDWGGAETLVSNKQPGEAARLREGEEHAQWGGGATPRRFCEELLTDQGH